MILSAGKAGKTRIITNRNYKERCSLPNLNLIAEISSSAEKLNKRDK